MNILTVVDAMHGGTAERAAKLTRALRRAGHEASVLDPRSAHSIGRRHPIPLAWRAISAAVARCDLLHLLGYWSLLHVLAYAAAMWHRKPYVFCPAGALGIFGRSQWLKRIYHALFGRRIVRHARLMIAVTEDEARAFEAAGIARSAIAILPNAVAPEDFEEAVPFRERPYILFLGRLAWVKGPDLLLDAFLRVGDRLPELDLVFAGNDEGMERGLRERASSRVHFAGVIGGAVKAGALRDAAFLALPSRSEVMSLVALEAGLCGTPVLATDACGLGEIVARGAGLVVPATVDGLAAGLVAMVHAPRDVMGARMHELVREKWLWDASVEAHLRVFTRAIAPRLPVGFEDGSAGA